MTTIVTKNGSGAPLASDLVQGELAVDLTNKRLYTEDTGGTVIEVGTNPSTIDINAGTIDGTVIGGASAAAGTFTTFTSTGIDDNATSTAITIDSSQNVGIGTGSPTPCGLLHLKFSATTDGLYLQNTTGGTVEYASFTANTSTGEVRIGATNASAGAYFPTFYSNGLERMRIDSSGNVGIGVTSPAQKLHMNGSILLENNNEIRVKDSGGTQRTAFWMSSNDLYLGTSAGGNLRFINGSSYTERMRIDSSGNLLVGMTSGIGTFSNNGVGISSQSNYIHAIRDGNIPLFVGRNTSDGEIVRFYKDNSTVGSIKSDNGKLVVNSDGTNLVFQVGGVSYINMDSLKIYPQSDNSYDLGGSSVRFDDVYATNGTIQTSDVNEKQDIEALSEAETRVAVAAKALLRKFRWKSAVEEKGDDARVHFGIIAQDLQAAFEAEGLDAGDYGMFIHSTWTDEETGEERSRMGVRYSELLAFIIAAI